MSKENYDIISLPKSTKKIAFSACHRIPERSFHWKGKPLLCYRCLGIDAGVIIPFILLVIGVFYSPLHPATLLTYIIPNTLIVFILFGFFTQLPFIIDGSLQAMTSYTSNNPLRLLTGLLGGIGQFFLLFSLGSILAILYDFVIMLFN